MEVDLQAQRAEGHTRQSSCRFKQRLFASSSREDTQVGHRSWIHMVHGRIDLFSVSSGSIHRPASDVLLSSDARICLHGYRRTG